MIKDIIFESTNTANMPHTTNIPTNNHLELEYEVIYDLYKDGERYATAWYIGHDGDFHVFVDADGVNCRYHIADLNQYAIASII